MSTEEPRDGTPPVGGAATSTGDGDAILDDLLDAEPGGSATDTSEDAAGPTEDADDGRGADAPQVLSNEDAWCVARHFAYLILGDEELRNSIRGPQGDGGDPGVAPSPTDVAAKINANPTFLDSVTKLIKPEVVAGVAASLKADQNFLGSVKGAPGRNAPLGWLYVAFGTAALALVLAIGAIWYATIVANAAMETTIVPPASTTTIGEVAPAPSPAPAEETFPAEPTTTENPLARYRQGGTMTPTTTEHPLDRYRQGQ